MIIFFPQARQLFVSFMAPGVLCVPLVVVRRTLRITKDAKFLTRVFRPAIASLLLIGGLSLHAQYYYYDNRYYSNNLVIEIGGSGGIMNCLTDIGGRKGTGKGFIKDLNMKFARPCFSLYAVAMYKEALGIRLEGTLGSVQAYDSILKPVASSTFGRYERNLNFRSNIAELHIGIEVHPLFFKIYDENEAPFWSPYVVTGINLFSFNPQAYLDGQWHYLHPLQTEGQGFAEYPERKPYKLVQLSVAAGIGLKYEISSTLNIRVEAIHRFLFTDYLDDVSNRDYIDPALFNNYLLPSRSVLAKQLYNRVKAGVKNGQRGNPANKDAFLSVQLKVGVCLRRQRVRW